MKQQTQENGNIIDKSEERSMQDKSALTEAYCQNGTAQKGTDSTECKTNERQTEVY